MSCRLVDLPPVHQSGEGSLGYAEAGPHIPFAVQRAFYLFDLAAGARRGGHAHRRDQQFLICLQGRVRVSTQRVDEQQVFTLSDCRQGLYLPSLTWIEILVEAPGTIVLVLAAQPYDEADYIRDHKQFRLAVAAEETGPGPADGTPAPAARQS